jgi:hypothetical protein
VRQNTLRLPARKVNAKLQCGRFDCPLLRDKLRGLYIKGGVGMLEVRQTSDEQVEQQVGAAPLGSMSSPYIDDVLAVVTSPHNGIR